MASIPYLLNFCCSAQFLKQEKFCIKSEEKRVGIRAGMGNICSVVKCVPKLEITNQSTVFKGSNAKPADKQSRKTTYGLIWYLIQLAELRI